MLDSFLRQVTKDSYGPVAFTEKTSIPSVVHKFNDGFSVLGWGRMPDPIADRGRIAAGVFSLLNEIYRSEESWNQFLRSPEALSFRKAGTSIPQSGNVSSMLNEISERLPVRSNYLGVIDEKVFKVLDSKSPLRAEHLVPRSALQERLKDTPCLYPVCEYFQEEKVPSATVMGRAVWDPSVWRGQAFPKMLPFQFLCHFTLNESSVESLRTSDLSIPKTAALHTLQPGVMWDFPVIELVLPQDPFRRRIGLSEAIWMTGLSASKLQELMLSAAWISAFARAQVRSFGLNLEFIELKFALQENQEPVLVDAFALDEMGLEKNGMRFQFETALEHYKKTSWYDAVTRSKNQALHLGSSEWRRNCVEPVPLLDPKVKTRVEEEFKVLATHLFGKSSDVL
ncbi:MAG: hypothetical protein KGP28_01095 [Bdellovibrionales bacterium]|nr:hypothetical protein [Bdellovibrionales bacterium]